MCAGYASLMMLINCARNLRQEDDYGEIKTPRQTRMQNHFPGSFRCTESINF